MLSQSRLEDFCTGHDNCLPTPLITSSETVKINSRGAARVGDIFSTHSCPIHPPHNDYIADGCKSVHINGVLSGRQTDPVLIGGNIRDGSNNVRVGM